MADGSDAVVAFDNSEKSEKSEDSSSDFVQGRLRKQAKYSKNWYHCLAKLEKDCFVYKRDDKQQYKLVYLVDVRLEHREENECIFIVIDTKRKKKKLVFKTDTPEQCREWMESLFDAILESKQNHQQQDKSEACTIQ